MLGAGGPEWRWRSDLALLPSPLRTLCAVPQHRCTGWGIFSCPGGPGFHQVVAGEQGAAATPLPPAQPKLRGLGGEHGWKNLGKKSTNRLPGLWAKTASVAHAWVTAQDSRDPLSWEQRSRPWEPTAPSGLPSLLSLFSTQSSDLLPTPPKQSCVAPSTVSALLGSSFLGRTKNLILSGIITNSGKDTPPPGRPSPAGAEKSDPVSLFQLHLWAFCSHPTPAWPLSCLGCPLGRYLNTFSGSHFREAAPVVL